LVAKAASSVDLTTEKGVTSVAIRLPEEWARKLGLIESGGDE
jgi:hypothetical protein